MKVIKLNRRFTQFREHGHVVGVKFTHWDDEARKLEVACAKLFKSHGWTRDARWYCYFGERRNGHFRPYWFTFRNEQDLTMALLSANLTQKDLA